MRNVILVGDVREQLRLIPDESVHCVVTSPPYFGLRDYGTAQWVGGDESCGHCAPQGGPSAKQESSAGTRAIQFASTCGKCGAVRIDSQLGLEATPEEYVASMVAVFRDVRRVLRRDGTLWLNLGDSYAHNGASGGSSPDGPRKPRETDREKQLQMGYHVPDGLKPKDLCGIPWRVAFALQADGWWLRSDIIWSKPNPMPESVTDRPTKAHEYIFLLTKSATYFYDQEAVREPHSRAWWTEATGGMPNPNRNDGGDRQGNNPSSGRNARTIWEIATKPYAEAHFATYPTELVKRCILAGTSAHGCCSVCGAPWERVVEVDGETPRDRKNRLGESSYALAQSLAGRPAQGLDYAGGHGSGIRPSLTTGWCATCQHEAPLTPAIVLDPFLGSGTTAAEAKIAGRDWLGIELNPAYVEMAKRRINVDQERLL